MSTVKFNLTGLKNIYLDALKQKDGTLIFEMIIGRGRFLFMMFFSEGDESKDELFIFMRNTNQMLKCKLYGSHRSGKLSPYNCVK